MPSRGKKLLKRGGRRKGKNTREREKKGPQNAEKTLADVELRLGQEKGKT